MIVLPVPMTTAAALGMIAAFFILLVIFLIACATSAILAPLQAIGAARQAKEQGNAIDAAAEQQAAQWILAWGDHQ